MQYPYLKYFIVVAELMSISKAAQFIHISQQGLSSYIRRLESYYQVELFTRKPELALTPAGQLLLEKARTIDRAFDQLDKAFHADHSLEPTVAIGIVNSAFRYFTEKRLLIQYRDLYPEILVRLEDILPGEIVQGVLSNQLHFGCTNVLQEHENLKYEYLFSQEFVLAVSESKLKQKMGERYPACIEAFQQGVDLREFVSIPYFGYPATFVISRLLGEYCEREGISFATRLENPTAEANMQMVMFGEGFTFLVKDRLPVFQREAESLGLPFHSFPIAAPELKIPYYLVSKTKRNYREHILKLMDLVRILLSQ